MDKTNQIVIVIMILQLISSIVNPWLQAYIARTATNPDSIPSTKRSRGFLFIFGIFSKPAFVFFVFFVVDLYLLVNLTSSREPISRLSVLLISLLSAFFIANLVLFVLSIVQRETIKTAKEGQSILDKTREDVRKLLAETDSFHSQNAAFFSKLSAMTDKKQTK